MNHKSAMISCTFLLVGGLAGFVGGFRYATRNQELAELTVPLTPGTGWHLASGIESGSALAAQPQPPQTAVESKTGSPEVVWFPEAVQTATSDSNSSEEFSDSGPGTTSGVAVFHGDSVPSSEPLTPEQREMWKNQIKGLSAVDVEELLQLRQRLSRVAGPVASTIEPLSSVDRPEELPDPVSEPGRLPLPAPDRLQPALPEGPLLPDSIELMSATRATPAPARLLLEQVGSAVSDNCANAATIGYRRREVRVLRAPVPASLVGKEASGAGSAPDVDPGTWITRLDLRPGPIVPTQNPFDVAIRSAGWFRVQCHGEECFTRSGLLATDGDRRLCVRTGRGLLPLLPEIVLPADMELMEIDKDGQVSVRVTGDGTIRVSGKIELVEFRDAGQLVWSPEGVFEATAKSGNPFPLPEEQVEIQQRSLEESNVDPGYEVKVLDRLRDVLSAGSTP